MTFDDKTPPPPILALGSIYNHIFMLEHARVSIVKTDVIRYNYFV